MENWRSVVVISRDVVESVRSCSCLADLYVLKGLVDKRIELVDEGVGLDDEEVSEDE